MEEGEEVRVDSWEEALAELYADAWSPDLNRYRLSYAFRGLATADHGLESKLLRLGNGDPEHAANVEDHLLRNFRKYARTEVREESIWHLLSVAEHHGLPTRLLDWTFSPLVALHFATADFRRTDTDGVVWAVDYVRAHEHLPESLRVQLEGADVFAAEMLPDADSMAAFDDRFDRTFPVFFEPPSLDERIVNQYALFSFLPDPTMRMDAWLSANPDAYRRVIVPGEVKMEIRDKLDQANVTERVLFPGLDGLAAWLERLYAPVDATPPDDAEPSGDAEPAGDAGPSEDR